MHAGTCLFLIIVLFWYSMELMVSWMHAQKTFLAISNKIRDWFQEGTRDCTVRMETGTQVPGAA